MKILVIGHSLVVDSNRKFWSVFAKENNSEVHLVVPRSWNSNLIRTLNYQSNSVTDAELKIYPNNVYFKGNGSFYFFHIFSLFKILKNNKFDAIIVDQETWSLSAFQLGSFKQFTKNKNTPAYLSIAQNIIKKKLQFAQPFERLVTSFYKTLFYCDPAICDVLKWKKIKNPTAYWPLIYDGDIYKRVIKSSNKRLTIGYLGRLSEEKGIRTLLKAFKELRDENLIPIELVVAGTGPLKDLIEGKDIHFLGPIPHNQAHVFYQKINLFILPSETTPFWKEQFGRVIVESVASGIPVIGSNSGAIPEVLRIIGLKTTFEEGNSDSLKNMIHKIWDEMNNNIWPEKMNHYYKNNLQFSHKSVAQKIYSEIKNG